MTVEELIEKLKKLPSDAIVAIPANKGSTSGWTDINEIRDCRVPTTADGGKTWVEGCLIMLDYEYKNDYFKLNTL